MATVVFVDANPSVLELAEQVLRDAGHRVLVTSDPVEAAELVGSIRIDLVVSCPDEAEDASTWPGSPRHLRLERPFSLDELRDAVAGLLQ